MRIAPHSCVFVVSWYRNKFLRASLFLIGYSNVYFKISLSWSRFTFSMAMDSCICRKIVVESSLVHPIKFPFKMALEKL